MPKKVRTKDYKIGDLVWFNSPANKEICYLILNVRHIMGSSRLELDCAFLFYGQITFVQIIEDKVNIYPVNKPIAIDFISRYVRCLGLFVINSINTLKSKEHNYLLKQQLFSIKSYLRFLKYIKVS